LEEKTTDSKKPANSEQQINGTIELALDLRQPNAKIRLVISDSSDLQKVFEKAHVRRNIYIYVL